MILESQEPVGERGIINWHAREKKVSLSEHWSDILLLLPLVQVHVCAAEQLHQPLVLKGGLALGVGGGVVRIGS